jgi:hypothetical protein
MVAYKPASEPLWDGCPVLASTIISHQPVDGGGSIAAEPHGLGCTSQKIRDLERQLLELNSAATLWQERCRVLEAQQSLPTPVDAPQRPWWAFWRALSKPSVG